MSTCSEITFFYPHALATLFSKVSWTEVNRKIARRDATGDPFLSCVPAFCFPSPPPPGGGQVFGDGTKTPPARSAPLLTPPNQSDPLRHPSPAIWSSFEPLPRGVRGVCVHDEGLHRCDYSCCSNSGCRWLRGRLSPAGNILVRKI